MTVTTHRIDRIAAKFAALILVCGLAFAPPAHSQAADEVKDSSPSGALLEILVAACRANQEQFANSLAGENPAAFRLLSLDQRTKVIKRISLSETAGRPLRSTGKDSLPVLRCQSETGTVEYRLGIPRTHENLAFIPVTVENDTAADFGLIRETGGWHLISIGLVMLDIPQLARQWADQDLAAQEDNAVANLRGLASAIQTYDRAFGKLPESLDQLGPAPKNQISPELASLVDLNMAAGKKDGYNFRYRIVPDSAGNDTAFELAATPVSYPKTGRRSFFLDGSGKIHGADNEGAVATFEDPLIAGEKSE